MSFSGRLTAGTTALSTTAVQVSTTTPQTQEVILQNDPDNAVDIFIGDSTSQPMQIAPGQSLTLHISGLDQLYAKSASGTPTLNWLARRA